MSKPVYIVYSHETQFDDEITETVHVYTSQAKAVKRVAELNSEESEDSDVSHFWGESELD